MALAGTLKDFGIADILQLIGQQQKTGVLYVKSKNEEVEVSFQNGEIVRSLSRTRKHRERIGAMMVNASMITQEVLDHCLEIQKRTLKRIGDILVAEGEISGAQLREMMQLQTTETIFKLFEWNAGTYEFTQQDVELDPGQAPPIRPEAVLMEGFRRIDEWPLIRKRVTSMNMSFERARALDLGSQQADDVDAAFDAVLGGGSPAPSDSSVRSVGPQERLVFALAEKDVTVQRLCDLSRLGEFETCKALFNLLDTGFLKGVAPRKGAPVQTERRPGPSVQIGRFFGGTAVQVGLGLALFVGICAALRASEDPVKVSVAAIPLESDGTAKLFADSQMSRISSALELFRISHGKYPDTLNDLVIDDIVPGEELRYPFETQYHYRAIGDSYILLPPLR